MPTVITRGAYSAQAYGYAAPAATAANYIEDVFSTYLYTGNSPSGGTQTITNSVDLSTKGGMVWIKGRSAASDHVLFDTARGAGTTASNNQALSSNLTTAEDLGASYDFLSAFNTDGFTVKQGGTTTATRGTNYNNVTYASWTFRKQAKFFDVVTYTGNGANRTISHNLGSVPGSIFVKRTDTTAAWAVYHRSLANTQYLVLNNIAAAATGATYWNSTTPTSSVFSLGTATDVNANGGTYVAYLFAHDAGGFGATGTDNVISCGSFTGAATNVNVSLGWEPQWLLIKRTNATDNWRLYDNMRGMTASNGGALLYADTSGAEQANNARISVNATGFGFVDDGANTNIYIAIRRGPMKTPTTGTSVFKVPYVRTGGGATQDITGPGYPLNDLVITKSSSNTETWAWTDRLRGATKELTSAATTVETTYANDLTSFAFMNGFQVGSGAGGQMNTSGYTYIDYTFKRAPGFFDVVCYTGTGPNQVVSHNLGVSPELIISKARSTTSNWFNAYIANPAGGTNSLFTSWSLNNTAAPSKTNLNNYGYVSASSYWPQIAYDYTGNNTPNDVGTTYVAYLFATLAGVSKVGSYTGTAALQTVNCGFTGGARFVLIKRTDSTGDWYVWDSTRGISSGNDPYLLLNSTAAEVTTTNYVDTDTTGFKVTAAAPAALNASGGSYIFLAIA